MSDATWEIFDFEPEFIPELHALASFEPVPVKDQLVAYARNPDPNAEPPYGPYAQYELGAAIREQVAETETGRTAYQESRAEWMQHLRLPGLRLQQDKEQQARQRWRGRDNPMLTREMVMEIADQAVTEMETWYTDRECKTLPRDNFFYEKTDKHIEASQKLVKKFEAVSSSCEICPVSEACLNYGKSIGKVALANSHGMFQNGLYGLYGGTIFRIPDPKLTHK